nr:hypothetical protein [Luteitalea pratensis]
MVGDDGRARVSGGAVHHVDAGGSNAYRSSAWKAGLQRLADDRQLAIHVSHFPRGNQQVEQDQAPLFCHITQNWRARPPRTFETVVAFIGTPAHRRSARGLARIRMRFMEN